jgi:plasmid stabilization system protein ParE
LAKLIYSGRAFADLERLTDFLIEADPSAAAETVGLIEEAVELLEAPSTYRPARRTWIAGVDHIQRAYRVCGPLQL